MNIHKVTKHGKSKSINIPHKICDKLSLTFGDHVRISLSPDDKIVIQKVQPLEQLTLQ